MCLMLVLSTAAAWSTVWTVPSVPYRGLHLHYGLISDVYNRNICITTGNGMALKQQSDPYLDTALEELVQFNKNSIV